MIRFIIIAAFLTLTSACATLEPPSDGIHGIFLLEAFPSTAVPGPGTDVVVGVSTPRTRAGFDTARMAFQRRPHEIGYFGRNVWADTPARMLAPLVVRSLQRSGAFRGVVALPHVAAVDRRLDLEVTRLLQDFSTKPSQVRFTLRAQLVDPATRRILATQEFDEVETAPTDDPYGGVMGANRILERLLGKVTEFTSQQSSAD